jgi:hypothetical protein
VTAAGGRAEDKIDLIAEIGGAAALGGEFEAELEPAADGGADDEGTPVAEASQEGP